MHHRTVLLFVAGLAVALEFAYSSPINIPATKVVEATNDNKLQEMKIKAENHISSKAKMPHIVDKGSKLEGESAPAASEASSSDSSSSGDDDTESKADFW